jgi:phospholipid-translocating ATPase
VNSFSGKDSEAFKDLWRCICLCHEVTQISLLGQKDSQGHEVTVLSGASQDEICFLEMAAQIGFVRFIERSEKSLLIDVNGNQEQYEVLKEIEFTSERKRMSVIVKNKETGRIVNFIKGADVAIIPRLAKGENTDSLINKMD